MERQLNGRPLRAPRWMPTAACVRTDGPAFRDLWRVRFITPP